MCLEWILQVFNVRWGSSELFLGRKGHTWKEQTVPGIWSHQRVCRPGHIVLLPTENTCVTENTQWLLLICWLQLDTVFVLRLWFLLLVSFVFVLAVLGLLRFYYFLRFASASWSELLASDVWYRYDFKQAWIVFVSRPLGSVLLAILSSLTTCGFWLLSPSVPWAFCGFYLFFLGAGLYLRSSLIVVLSFWWFVLLALFRFVAFDFLRLLPPVSCDSLGFLRFCPNYLSWRWFSCGFVYYQFWASDGYRSFTSPFL